MGSRAFATARLTNVAPTSPSSPIGLGAGSSTTAGVSSSSTRTGYASAQSNGIGSSVASISTVPTLVTQGGATISAQPACSDGV